MGASSPIGVAAVLDESDAAGRRGPRKRAGVLRRSEKDDQQDDDEGDEDERADSDVHLRLLFGSG
jgi:hypothetical protein